MRTASLLLSLVMVLGFVRESGADIVFPVRDYTAKIAGHSVGFIDWPPFDSPAGQEPGYTMMHVGPLGSFKIPFTATLGLIGVCLIVVTFVAGVALLTVRWKKKRTA
jgi:hypothetical protein